MIDSVLKGTGNSRFLKSAVPAGTSWADALAMLQAGAFPIDFNGINTEGFQQVGTPLNKANLLKDATAAQIGLPPSTTPDGMFQALGNTGELHVWRKTVVNASAKPAGYTLGSGTNLTLVKSTERYGQGSTYWVPAASISVNDGGAINEITGSSVQVYYEKEESELKSAFWGKFIKFSSESDYGNVPDKDGVWFIPNSATIQKTTGGNYYYLTVVGAQKVNPYPLTPAGTTTTYPVSTNPNAYQEGSDAKPAGYTLGEVETGSFAITSKSSPGGVGTRWNDSSALSVSDDGTCTLATTGGTYIDGTTTNAATTAKNELQGKFAYCNNTDTDFTSSVIVFFPSNTIFTRVGNIVYADRYQPVTGYAAIPAGTTIEYLGKLGDKARVQVVSYVGTGTYGSGKETKIPVDFSPELLIIAVKDITRRTVYISVPRSGTGLYLSADGSSSIYGEMAATVSYVDGKVHIQCSDSFGQMNASGYAYIAVAMS